MEDWKVVSSKNILHTPIWDVIETEKIMPNGKSGKFVSLDAPNWISAVVKNIDDNTFIMNKEFRQGPNKKIIEFPCGTIEDNETPEEACIREVKEETGFQNVKIITKLFTGNPNAAFMNNRMIAFYVEVSGKKESQELDDTEDITTLVVENPDTVINDDTPIISQFAWFAYKYYFVLKKVSEF